MLIRKTEIAVSGNVAEQQRTGQRSRLERADRQALVERGILELYSHQAECYDIIRGGRNVVVVTPTAVTGNFTVNNGTALLA